MGLNSNSPVKSKYFFSIAPIRRLAVPTLTKIKRGISSGVRTGLTRKNRIWEKTTAVKRNKIRSGMWMLPMCVKGRFVYGGIRDVPPMILRMPRTG